MKNRVSITFNWNYNFNPRYKAALQRATVFTHEQTELKKRTREYMA